MTLFGSRRILSRPVTGDTSVSRDYGQSRRGRLVTAVHVGLIDRGTAT